MGDQCRCLCSRLDWMEPQGDMCPGNINPPLARLSIVRGHWTWQKEQPINGGTEEGEQRKGEGSFSIYYYLGCWATQAPFGTGAPLCKDGKKDHRTRTLDLDSILVSITAFLWVHIFVHDSKSWVYSTTQGHGTLQQDSDQGLGYTGTPHCALSRKHQHLLHRLSVICHVLWLITY